MVIMAEEPAKNLSPAEIEAHYVNLRSPQDLADAYAITHNQFWWVEDDCYDFEDGTPEHQAACAITDQWSNLMSQYLAQIFALLQSEGVAIPDSGQNAVLQPFMEKYGYTDGNGWWVKRDM